MPEEQPSSFSWLEVFTDSVHVRHGQIVSQGTRALVSTVVAAASGRSSVATALADSARRTEEHIARAAAFARQLFHFQTSGGESAE
jgi:hypothetical protein